MKYIIYNQVPYIEYLSKKNYEPAIDKYVVQCGFTNHIERTIKACKQINQSVYVLFWLFRAYIQFF